MNKLILYALFFAIVSCENKFEEAMTKLDDLENYANEYFKIKNDTSVDELILRYIRTGRYDSTEWTLAAGATPTEFINYVETQDAEKGKKTSDLRNYKEGDILLPDSEEGTTTDFVHMFAVMNGIDYQKSYTKDLTVLQGFGGDIAQLFQDIFSLSPSLGLDKLIESAREKLGVSGGFGEADVISDLDCVGYYALKMKNTNKKYSYVFRAYLEDLSLPKRVEYFLQMTFPELYTSKAATKEDFRNAVFNIYDKNNYIKIWECKNNLREGQMSCLLTGDVKDGKDDNRKAACYAFADYLFENKPNFQFKFDEAMKKLDNLENYAKEYFKTKSDISVDELILRYIRTGRYDSEEWKLAAGATPTEFIKYVETQDSEKIKTTSDLRNYKEEDILLPDTVEGTATDFVHMFAVMNGIDYQKSYSSDLTVLQGFAGDIAELFKDIFAISPDSGLDKLIGYAKEYLGVKGSFGKADLISDLDSVGYYSLKKKNTDKTYSTVLRTYLQDVDLTKRVGNFLTMTFPDICYNTTTKEEYRNAVFNIYDKNIYIKTLECKNGLREDKGMSCLMTGEIINGRENNRKAACYAFADFIYENRPEFGPKPPSGSSNYNKLCMIFTLFLLALVF